MAGRGPALRRGWDGATSLVLPTLGGLGLGSGELCRPWRRCTGRLQDAAAALPLLCRQPWGHSPSRGTAGQTAVSVAVTPPSLHEQRATGAPDRMFPGPRVGLPSRLPFCCLSFCLSYRNDSKEGMRPHPRWQEAEGPSSCLHRA